VSLVPTSGDADGFRSGGIDGHSRRPSQVVRLDRTPAGSVGILLGEPRYSIDPNARLHE
jgi:hypothetical protein